MKRLSLIFGFCLASFLAFSQADTLTQAERTAIAGQAIQDLKNGYLIVRLSSNSKKMQELERLIATGQPGEKQKDRWQKMLETTRSETEWESAVLRRAFTENYQFSKVLFLFDTASASLKKGVRRGIFLNPAAAASEIDNSIVMENAPYLLVSYGSGTSGATMLRVMDKTGEVMRSPFPYFATYKSFAAFLLNLPPYTSLMREEKRRIRSVKKLNDKFEKYFEATN